MLAADPRSADRLLDLITEFRTGNRLRRKRSGGRSGTPWAGGVAVHGSFFARTLHPGGHDIDRDWDVFCNAATTEGLNAILEGGFRAGTQYASWYLGLITNTAFSGVSAADTMASHAGWAEFTGYTEGTRRQWSPTAASGGTLVNASAIQFTNGGSSASIIGCFVTTDNTKAGATGKLWATATEASARSLSAAQVFQVYYELDFVPQS